MAVGAAGVTLAVVAVLALPSSSTGPVVGLSTVAPHPASAFRLPSLDRASPAVTLNGSAGHPVLISFFASWCTGCQQELRSMATVEAVAAGERVRIIGVDVNDTDAVARALLRRDHVGYPVGVDGHGALADAYRLVGLPTTVVLDVRHRVVGQVIGPLSEPVALAWIHRVAGRSGVVTGPAVGADQTKGEP